MKRFWIYLCLEFKKSIKVLGTTIIGVLVMVAFLAMGVAAVSYVLLQSQVFSKVEVAVVIPDDEAKTKLAVQYVSNMDSVKSICDFSYMDKENAKRALRDGTVKAVIEFPEHFFEDVYVGKNTPPYIYFSDTDQTAVLLFRELLNSGVELLQTSEAGVYASLAISKEYPTKIARGELGDYVAALYAKQILKRNRIFEKEILSPLGVYKLEQFYFVTGMLCILLMSGLKFGYLYKKQNCVIVRQLRIYGVGLWQVSIVRMLVMAVMLWILAVFIYLTVGILSKILALDFIYLEITALARLFLLSLSLAAYFHVVYSVSEDTMSGTLLVLICNLVLIIVSGVLVPAVYLPQLVQRLGEYVPLTFWHQYCCEAVFLEGAGLPTVQLLAVCMLGMGIGTIALWKNT